MSSASKMRDGPSDAARAGQAAQAEGHVITAEFAATRPWAQKLAAHFRLHCGLDLAELVPGSVRGYWMRRKACGGLAGGCRHPLHAYLGRQNAMNHSASFTDPSTLVKGRFFSPYRTWKLACEALADGTWPGGDP